MAEFIDQAIFDAGVLVLGAIGIKELEKQRHKFQIDDLINSYDVIRTYQNLRPKDELYVPQSKQALDWLLTSVPIGISNDIASTLFRAAYETRKSLNAEMQPNSLRERLFKGAIFQSESKNYLNRAQQSKINICQILTEISNPHHEILNNLSNFERKISPISISLFIKRTSKLLLDNLHKPYRVDELTTGTKLHFSCTLAAACYLSTIRRLDNFPVYKSGLNSSAIADIYRRAIADVLSGFVESRVAESCLEVYINSYMENHEEIFYKSENEIWSNLPFNLTTSIYINSDDDELSDFLSMCAEHVNSYDLSDVYSIEFENIGKSFLG